jgi:hypothetical protein
MTKQNLLILCKNQAEKAMAIALLYGAGYKYNDQETLEDCLIENGDDLNDRMFPNVLLNFDNGDGFIDMCIPSYKHSGVTYKLTETTAIMKFLTEGIKPVEVKLTNDYTAVLCPSYIKVGCQEIPYDKFYALVEAVKQYKK